MQPVSSDVTKLALLIQTFRPGLRNFPKSAKIRIRRMRILTFKIRRMRMRKAFIFSVGT